MDFHVILYKQGGFDFYGGCTDSFVLETLDFIHSFIRCIKCLLCALVLKIHSGE